MRTVWFIPIIYLFFASISITVLQSVEPQLVTNQVIFFATGAMIVFVLSQIPLKFLKILLPLAYFSSIGLLVFTTILGNITRGTVSWIPIGPFHIQPSQIAVPLTLILQSLWIDSTRLKTFWQQMFFGILWLVPFSLIFLEPDLGTGMVFLFSSFSLFTFSPIKKRFVLLTLLFITISAIFSWQYILKPYQKERLTSFVSSADRQGAGYNSYQSLVAVGSGQLWGRGLGHGIQSQLRFLPEHQTDFIFASIAEETGLIGSSFVLILYFLLLNYIFHTISEIKTDFAKYALLGFAFLIFYQMLINVGMNMGILPITGITLPLISYGGSSILSFALIFGLIVRIIYEEKKWKSIRIQ